MKKSSKTILILLALTLSLAPLFAASQLATTKDGTIYILKDDNTYEAFKQKTYDQDKGYRVSNPSTLSFLNNKWDDITLTALGNYLPSSSPYTLGSYTTGEYYLLQLKSENISSNLYSNDHEIPSLKLSDGTVIEGTNERVQATSSSSVVGWYTKKQSTRTYTYSVLYEIPEGKTPQNLVFKTGTDSTTLNLGSFKTL